MIVPDHMGFGKSEAPQEREYTLQTHVENLAALIEELDLHEITFVIQDWGGPIGGCYTALHPERVKRLCLLNTVAPLMAPPRPSARPGLSGSATGWRTARWTRCWATSAERC